MALESFYGGKQGISPVIKASFEFVNTDDPAYQYKLNSGELLLTEKERRRLEAYDFDIEESITSINWSADTLKPFTMNECFKDVNYTDVWYGEYCIIDTQNKMNPNNGKIFRRSLKRYQNPVTTGFTDLDSLYAEYIGQIVGPAGGVPNIVIGSIDDVRKDAAGRYINNDGEEAYSNTEFWDYLYPDALDEDANFTRDNVRNRRIPDENNDNKPLQVLAKYRSGHQTANYKDTDSNADDYEQIAVLNANENGNITTVPGKDGANFNDTIRYTWCNVRHNLDNNNNTEDSAWMYLGFEIPYTFWDTTAEEIPYWDDRPSLRDDTQTVEGKFHPFYHNLTFYIPRGARGIGPEELFIVGKDGRTKNFTLYNFDAIQYNSDNDSYSVDTNKIINPSEATYWVAKWKLYNPKVGEANSKTPTEVHQYIGAYRDVSEITYTDNTGEFTVKYSDGSSATIGTIDYVKSITVDTNKIIDNQLNDNYGKIYTISNINYPNKKTDTGTTLPLIKKMEINQYGNLLVYYAGVADPDNVGHVQGTAGSDATLDHIVSFINKSSNPSSSLPPSGVQNTQIKFNYYEVGVTSSTIDSSLNTLWL